MQHGVQDFEKLKNTMIVLFGVVNGVEIKV